MNSEPDYTMNVTNKTYKELLSNVRKMLSENPTPPIIVLGSHRPCLADSIFTIQRTPHLPDEAVCVQQTKHRVRQCS